MPIMQSARSQISNLLNWPPGNKAWLAYTLLALMHTQYLIWNLLVLELPSAAAYIDLEQSRRILPFAMAIAATSWFLVLVVAGLRLVRPQSIVHEYACNLYWAVSLCAFSYFIGTMTMATGVVLAGGPVLGFILFRAKPVLCSLAVGVILLITLSIGSVMGWWGYAPMISSPVGTDGRLSGFWLVSMYLFIGPHLIVITLFSWYGLSGWRRREAAVRELSLTDSLTRLANRRAIFARLIHERESSARTRRPLSVIMLDLDHFKEVNDTHGHASGDLVLQAAAERLESALRQSDHIGRFGGEEFLIVLPGTDQKGAWMLADRCRATLASEPVTIADGGQIQVTASLGLYCNDGDWDASPDDMLRRADEKLYRAKERGRNRVVE